MNRHFKSGRLTKIVALMLVIIFSTQQIAWAKKIDLREDGDITSLDVVIAVITGFLSGKSVSGSSSIGRALFSTYAVPVIAGKVVDRLHIKNKYLAAAAKVALTIGINAGTSASTGADAAKEGVKGAASSSSGSIISSLKEGFKHIIKSFNVSSIKTVLRNFWNSLKTSLGKLGKGFTMQGLKDYAQKMGKDFSRFWNSLKGIGNIFKNGVKNLGKYFKDLGSSPGQTLARTGLDIKSGLKTGLASFKMFLSQKFWQAFLWKGLQGAVYSYANNRIYDKLREHNGATTAEFSAQLSAMIASEMVDWGLSEITGLSAQITNKGRLVFAEGQGQGLAMRLGNIALSAIPYGIQAIAQNNQWSGQGILISGIYNAFYDYFSQYSKLTEEEKNMPPEQLQNRRYDEAEDNLSGEKKKIFQGLREEAQLTPEQERQFNDLYSQAEDNHMRLLNLWEDRKKLTSALASEQNIEGPPDYERILQLKGQIGRLAWEIRQRERGAGGFLRDNLISSAISIGLQKLSQSGSLKEERYAGYGIILNYFGSSLLKALYTDLFYPVFYQPEGIKLAEADTSQASKDSLQKVDKSLWTHLGVIDSLVTRDFIDTMAEAASMGSMKARYDIFGQLDGLTLVNPYDSFFIARYNDYIQNAGGDEVMMFGIIPLWGSAAAEQILTSLHNQSVKNVQNVMDDIFHQLGLSSASPLEKTYVFTYVQPFLNAQIRYATQVAVRAALNELTSREAKEICPELGDILGEDWEDKRGQAVITMYEKLLALKDKLITQSTTGDLDEVTKAAVNHIINNIDQAYENSIERYYFGSGGPYIMGPLMVLYKSLNQADLQAGRATPEERGEALASRKNNPELNRQAEAALGFVGPQPESAKDNFLDQNTELKGIDIYEDLSGNSRSVVGVFGARPQQPPAQPAKIKVNQEIETTVNARLTFFFSQAVLTPAAKQALDKLTAVWQENPEAKFEIFSPIVGRTDSYGSTDFNQKLGAERAQSVKEYLKTNGVPEDKLVINSLGESQAEARQGDVVSQARERSAEVNLTLKSNQEVEVLAGQESLVKPISRMISAETLPKVTLQEYRVKPGDNPATIAQSELGYQAAGQRILDATNVERAKRGLPPLKAETLKPGDVLYIPKEQEPSLKIITISSVNDPHLKELETNGPRPGASYDVNTGDPQVDAAIFGYMELRRINTLLRGGLVPSLR